MKKLSVVLNVVLLVAVAGLYYMQFSCPSSCGTSTKASTGLATAKSGVIAYVNMDSLERNYKFFTDLAEKFGKKAQESEKEFATRKKVFQEEVIDFQRKVKKEMLTPNQAKALQQQLAEKEQKLARVAQEMQYDISKQNAELQKRLHDTIVNYIKEYNNGKFSAILTKRLGDNVLYSSESIDITEDIVNGLNEKYTKEK